MIKLAKQLAAGIKVVMAEAIPVAEMLYANHDRIKEASTKVAIYWDYLNDKYLAKTGTLSPEEKSVPAKLSNCFFSPECPIKVACKEDFDTTNMVLLYRPSYYRPIKGIEKQALLSTPAGLMLGGALVSGGAGYGLGRGLGWLYEDTPEEADRRGKTVAFYGSLAGLLPGAVQGLSHKMHSRDYYGNSDLGWGSAFLNSTDTVRQQSPNFGMNMDRMKMQRQSQDSRTFDRNPDGSYAWQGQHKEGNYINVNSFNEAVWDDAGRGRTDVRDALLTTSIMNRAGMQNGGVATPSSIMGTLVDAGVGYMTAAVAGKALGALGLLPNGYQEKLKDMGAWAGVLHSVSSTLTR